MMHGTFHILWINAVIQVTCIVSWTSLFTCQMIVFTYFLSAGLNGLAQIKQFVALLYSLGYSWVSRFIGTLLAKCFLEMVAVANIWYIQKFFHWRHPLYLLGVLQCIVHHCLSRRCSFHMVRDAGIGWWRILIMMAHTSLVYIELVRNLRTWQKLNVGGIQFL